MFTASGSLSSADPMKRSGFKRRTRLRPVNSKRRKRQYDRNYGERADAIRAMPCLVHERCDGVSNCAGDIVAAHTTARGMGGAKGDRRKLAPLCWWHHGEAGEKRTSQRRAFEVRYGFESLDGEADKIAVLLDEQGYE